MPERRTATRKGEPTIQLPEVEAGTEASAAEVVGTTEPKPLTEGQVAEAAGPPTITEAGPTQAPPGAQVGGAVATQAVAAGVTATWRTSVMVTALWSINEVRNAWAYLAGVGWKKLYNGRDGAFTALVTLASQARETGRPITAREEADGMIYEIYLW